MNLIGQCPSSFFRCCVNTLTESNLREERIYLAYMPTLQSVFERIQEMNSSRNTSLEKCCLLVCFPLFTQPASLYNLGPPVWVTHTQGLGSLTLTVNQENASETCLQAILKQRIPQVSHPLPRCYKFVSN